jgi:hypothetical protein
MKKRTDKCYEKGAGPLPKSGLAPSFSPDCGSSAWSTGYTNKAYKYLRKKENPISRILFFLSISLML